MPPSTTRDRKAAATRERIAEAALDLFVSRGFAETTIDDIARAAEVGRRTVFRHFTTKEAILFDHLVVRRDVAVQLLRERPPTEPTLVSLYAVLRELCARGYDRRALAQIRTVLATTPALAMAEFSGGLRAFERNVIAVLRRREPDRMSALEAQALTLMAFSWMDASARIFLTENRPSLVKCFDEVVSTCMKSIQGDLRPALRRAQSALPPELGTARST